MGVIDLGTNTVLCTVLFGEPRDARRLRIAEDLHFVTGLGRDRGEDGSLHPAGTARALRALRHVSRRLRELGVPPSAVRGAATAACREAPDGPALLAHIREQLGLPLHVVHGEREADLVALAQRHSFLEQEPLLVIDIGGGSTEIALTAGDEWRVSIPVGATKLSEALGPSPSVADTRALVTSHVASQALGPLPSTSTLVGVAGTVTSALQIADAHAVWDPTTLHGRVLRRVDIVALGERLLSMTPAARRSIAGLHPGRADALGPACFWLDALMDRLGHQQLLVSDRGVRFGLLFEAWPRAVVL
ncbi:MAG: hypothetical protein KDA24_19515 [Deltaproteobacteria bacterium]|nr:hypothetical protein [Deltaproteobacteria bacterium]